MEGGCKTPEKKRTSRYTTWDIDVCQEEYLLKSTSSSSLKRKRMRTSLIVSPMPKRALFTSPTGSQHQIKALLPAIVGTLYDISLLSPLKPVSKYTELITIESTPESPLNTESFKSSIKSCFSSPICQKIESPTPFNSSPLLKKTSTSPYRLKPIRYKDQAVSQVLLKISQESMDSSFFDILIQQFNFSGIKYQLAPKDSIFPYHFILERYPGMYFNEKPSSANLNPTCPEYGGDDLATYAGTRLFCITMSLNELEQLNTNIYDLLALHENSYDIYKRIFLIIRPEISGKKSKGNKIVFPDHNQETIKKKTDQLILDLKLEKRLNILDWRTDTLASLSTMIVELIRTAAFEPFKKKLTNETIPYIGKKGKDQQESFKKMLLLINGVSDPVATAICNKYSTLGGLMQLLKDKEEKEGTKQASLTFADITVYRPNSTKTIGITLSQRIFQILMGSNPESKISAN